MQNRILLIEDDERISSVIKRGLEENGYIVEQAWDGKAGQKLFDRNTYDLAIVDIVMPKMTGLELCAEIRKKDRYFPIIMLTALGTTDDKVEGFDAGADDYLVKPFDLRELLVRIKALLKRNNKPKAPEESVLEYSGLKLFIDKKTCSRNGQEIRLTPKEFNLLQYMMVNPERVLSRSEIAENVWKVDFDTGTNFIDVYINYLRKKIDKNFEEKLIHTQPGMGFVLRKEA